MTDRELYVINRALDGMDIYALSSIRDLKLSEITIQTIKHQLILKNILSDEETFTQKGLIITKMLDEYKKAKKYLTINNITIGINDNKSVMLMYNALMDEYKIGYLQKSNWIDDVVKSYAFIGENDFSCDEFEKEIEESCFEENYKVGKEHCFNIVYHINKKDFKYKILCFEDGLYLYDYNVKILYKKQKSNLVDLLKEKVNT